RARGEGLPAHLHADCITPCRAQIPGLYIHAKENRADDGTLLCAASREQAERAVSYIGSDCRLIETDTGDPVIHTVHKDFYIGAVNSMHP
ncbi:MAG: hypothetical protein II581_01620, partial [Oscillospiraceae bacterium]|nr:hypothetical protein [Oscillospiraceae bacterium]